MKSYPTPSDDRWKTVEAAGKTIRPDDYFNRRRLNKLGDDYWSAAYVLDVDPEADTVTVFLLKEEETATVSTDDLADHIKDGDVHFTGDRWTE